MALCPRASAFVFVSVSASLMLCPSSMCTPACAHMHRDAQATRAHDALLCVAWSHLHARAPAPNVPARGARLKDIASASCP
eukprot:10731820-Alexandrium_andersonii.AAC.1